MYFVITTDQLVSFLVLRLTSSNYRFYVCNCGLLNEICSNIICCCFISIGYGKLRDLIAKDGYMGVKAFFWAELDLEAKDGSFRVFHGKCAPYQAW